jgi:heme/copper-type cytochrome/quinol oxidase subunit 4
MRVDETQAAVDSEAASAETHARHGYVGYVVVAVILSAITIVEIAIPSVEAINAALTRAGTVAVLLALSFVKGAGVVMYYMHLRHDNRLFAALFLLPFVIASTIVIVLFLFFTLVGF